MEIHIEKSRFSVKSRFKESKCADRGHSLNRDFTVQAEIHTLLMMVVITVVIGSARFAPKKVH